MKPTPQQRIWMYETMLKSRLFDDAVFEAYWEGKKPVFHMGKGPLPGEMHQSFGQEPTAVGVVAHLGPDDAVGAGHRPHHVAIARGVNLERMAAELFGKKTGLSGGRGGHMHLYDNKVNFFCSGIIAEGMGPGAGMALARKLQKKPGIAVAYNGREPGRLSRSDEHGGPVEIAVRLCDRGQQVRRVGHDPGVHGRAGVETRRRL